jgi:hypothetical protein
VLVNRAIPALYNGISQQPATLRLPSQSEVQINGWSTVVEGLKQRPPFQHSAQISTGSLSTAHLHVINRTLSQRFVVVVTNGDIKVFDLAGNQKVINFPNGKAYLTVSNAQEDFSTTTVADYTFIVNKTKQIVMKPAGDDQTAQPGTYVWLNTSLAAGDISTNPYSSAPRRQYSPNPFRGTFQGSKQSFDSLPKSNDAVPPQEGDMWKIEGDQSSGFTAYYVVYNGGVWNETVAPALQNAIDETTMPWALVHNADDTFDFVPFSWAPRRVGDETTNPNPSFVGRTINDVFFYQNRLGFLTGENIVLSAAGDFGNFYRLTVLQLLPDSVVDIGASETNVTNMNFAVPFAQGLMLFSDQTQFRLVTPLDGSFGPTTVSLQVATRYIASQTVRPLMLGSDVYFASEDDAYAHLREYFVKLNYTGQIQTDADDVSSHVPKYIPKGCYLLEGSNNHDAVFLATSAQPNRLYVYKFYWSNEQTKAQSAWGYWDFGAGNSVLACAGLDDYLYAVVAHPDGTFIEKMSLAVGANVGITDNNGKYFDLMLDRRCYVSGTYVPAPGDYTDIILPYAPDQSSFRLVAGNDAPVPGVLIDPATYSFPNTVTVRVPGQAAGHLYAGNAYEFRYRFSEQFMLNQNNVAILSGRLTLHNWTVYFVDTAYFRCEVDPYGQGAPTVTEFVPAEESQYTGMTVGSQALITDQPNFRTGKASFGVMGQSSEATIDLVNDTPFPVTFFEAEWEADYNNRGRTI